MCQSIYVFFLLLRGIIERMRDTDKAFIQLIILKLEYVYNGLFSSQMSVLTIFVHPQFIVNFCKEIS